MKNIKELLKPYWYLAGIVGCILSLYFFTVNFDSIPESYQNGNGFLMFLIVIIGIILILGLIINWEDLWLYSGIAFDELQSERATRKKKQPPRKVQKIKGKKRNKEELKIFLSELPVRKTQFVDDLGNFLERIMGRRTGDEEYGNESMVFIENSIVSFVDVYFYSHKVESLKTDFYVYAIKPSLLSINFNSNYMISVAQLASILERDCLELCKQKYGSAIIPVKQNTQTV